MANKSFFDLIRPHFGGTLTQRQIDGINAIVAGFALYGDGDTNKLADILATVKWETGGKMQPVYEKGSKAYLSKYEPGTKLGKMLGNTEPGDSVRFKGTGLPQLTGRRNFAYWAKRLNIDLIEHPEKALEMDVSVRILVEGSMLGSFTGKSLADYIDGVDESDEEDLLEYIQARRVINGQDKAEVIGKSALVFEKALRASATPSTPVPIPVPKPKPAPTPQPVVETPAPEPTIWDRLVAWLMAIFGRKA